MMKKKLLTTVCILFVVVTSNAQQLSYGIKAGANLSSMNIKEGNTKLGFNGGIFGQLRMAKFAVQPELLFSTQGANYDYERHIDDMIFNNFTGKVSTNYLSIPVMLQYYILSGLNIEAGPQVSFLLSAKDKPDEWESSKVKEYMKKTDVALNFGLSYKLPLVPVGFYARYSLGLTDVFEKENNPIFQGQKGKNRIMQIGAFVTF